MRLLIFTLSILCSVDCLAADWETLEWTDPFGEKKELIAELVTENQPTLRLICTRPETKHPWPAFQIDLSGESRRIESSFSVLGSNEEAKFKYSFDGQKSKVAGFYISGKGTQFLLNDMVLWTGGYAAARWARAALIHKKLVLQIFTGRGDDRSVRLDLDGNHDALISILTACKEKITGRTASKTKSR